MSRRGKAKAVGHQNEVRDLLRILLCPPFDKADIESRPMGQSGSDIILSPDILKVFPFYIECKRHEDKTWNGSCVSSWMQVCDNKYPLLIRRKNRGKNHYFAKIEDVLEFHPRILMSNKPLKMYRSLREMLKSDSYNIGIAEEYVHFDDGKFVELVQCLKNIYFQ